MLEIVEEEQLLAWRQGVSDIVQQGTATCLTNAKSGGNGSQDRGGIAQWCQIDKDDPIAKVTGETCGELDREPRLADAASASEGDQPHIIPSQQSLQCGEFLPTTNQTR
jgi:hypothetical protein